MHPREFVDHLIEQLARELTANNAIRKFTTNKDIIGAYAEASVRQLVARIVDPLRVSRGGIVWEGICPDDVPQVDTIIWSPCPMPAMFEAGDFALVPRGSAHGFLEIKRSNYKNTVGEKLTVALDREQDLS